MKKFLAMMMTMTMVFGAAACGGEEAPVEEPVDKAVVTESDGGADGFTLWDVATVETPALEDTTWYFCGGYMNDTEMTQEEYEATMEMYGGTLQFVIHADGTAEMVQGGGTLQGEAVYLEDGAGLIFDNNGEELRYACIFIDLDGLTMVAMPDDTGEMGMYFAQ